MEEGPVARRHRVEDGEAEQTRRARRGREQDFAEISRRMYEEIRSSRDPRGPCGRRLVLVPHREDDPG